jgi:protein phosphatase
MEHIAVISDIHGNQPALEAVLNDIDRRGIKRIMCLGDLVGKGPDPAMAVDVCRERCEAIVRGNWDEILAAPNDKPVFQWHQKRLGAARMMFLASLPNTIDLAISGKRIRLFHASAHGNGFRVHMNDDVAKQLGLFANTPFSGNGPAPDIVGYGDIHRAYIKSFQQQILFNAGSVGNPIDLTQAAYAILEGTLDSSAESPLAIQIVRVPYDIERAVRDAEQVDMPELDEYAKELRTARYRGMPAST